MNLFEQFESEVLNRIFEENTMLEKKLKKQYQYSKVISREVSDYGFYTYFEVIDKSLKLKNDLNIELGNVQAKINSLKFGAGFILFIRDGFIKALECYTYGELWPKNITQYKLV